MKIIFMFSGQGSHYYQMGSRLMTSESTFRETMMELDGLSRSLQGISVVERLYDTRQKLSDPLTTLRISHPAILMVGYSLGKMLEKQGIKPDCVVGFSLGEFAAAALADAMPIRDAMQLVIRQAEEIESRCKPGGLVAVLDSPDIYTGNKEMANGSWLASVNSPTQFVIAAQRSELENIKQFMRTKDILHQELAVDYAFHSPGIEPAAAGFTALLKDRVYNRPVPTWISGMSGNRIATVPQDYFWDVVRQPIAYRAAFETIQQLYKNREELVFLDAGPAGSLANIVKAHIEDGQQYRSFQLMSPFQQETKKLKELLGYCLPRIPAPAVRRERLLAYVFPGQGSQKKGMGEGLFEYFPELTAAASRILGYSIRELCLSNPANQLNQTQYTQPALFVVNALHYLKKIEGTQERPDWLAGHSLGEYNALFASGAMDFDTGVALVAKRGSLMAKVTDGGMAAVKGLSLAAIGRIIRDNGLEAIDIANQNSANQVVLSGPRQLIEKSGHFFLDAGATLYFPLNVSGAFHSRYMASAKAEFAAFLGQFHFAPLTVPVVSNVEATPYRNDRIAEGLAEQLVRPVRWLDSIGYILKQGDDVAIQEIGPGDVLTKLVYGIRRDMAEPVQ